MAEKRKEGLAETLAEYANEEKKLKKALKAELKKENEKYKKRNAEIHKKYDDKFESLHQRRLDAKEKFGTTPKDETSTETAIENSSNRPAKRVASPERPSTEHSHKKQKTKKEADATVASLPGQNAHWYTIPENQTNPGTSNFIFHKGLGLSKNQYHLQQLRTDKVAKAASLLLPELPNPFPTNGFKDFKVWYSEIVEPIPHKHILSQLPNQQWVKKAVENMMVKAIFREASKPGFKWSVAGCIGLFKLHCERKGENKVNQVYTWKYERGHQIQMHFEGAFIFKSTDRNVIIKDWAIRPTENATLKYDTQNSDVAKWESDDGSLSIWLKFDDDKGRGKFLRIYRAGWSEKSLVPE